MFSVRNGLAAPAMLAAVWLTMGCSGDAGLDENLGVTDEALSSCTVSDNPAWKVNTSYATGARVSYSGKVYEAVQGHTSRTGWEPTNTPSLWRIPNACATTAWAAQTNYAVGNIVEFGGASYKCVQAHTSLSGWEPPLTPALWQLTSSLPSGLTNEKALVLIDSRLYSRISSKLDQYVSLAKQRRGFGIALQVIEGIDDWGFATVKSHIQQQRSVDSALEGVLFVGNIKLPSFFQSRTDTADTRLLPRYYEDLDGVFSKRLTQGSTLPLCPIPWVETYNCYASQFTVPAHDFDFIARGSAPDPEIWTSYMPVGTDGVNTYDGFAAQLGPYLDKVISYYQGGFTGNGRYYYVSADIGEEPEKAWDAFGKTKLDIYGKPGPNGETGYACIQGSNNLCYKRWATENYADVQSFVTDFQRKWVDEGWQEARILKEHANAAIYSVLQINVHSNEYFSIVTSQEAAAITKGGLFTALDGCAVSGYYQPGSPSYVNTGASVAANVLMSFVYGAGKSIAGSGDPFWRGHYAKHTTMYKHMKTVSGSYLGKAHLERNKEQYQKATSDGELREFGMEMLVGDPFMNL
ncbi:MAG TPA: carbohydrate-binding protein [Polyangiaceae bacterium]|nr:carbohydrate-binding protein [Polyangiaceae bacterium]